MNKRRATEKKKGGSTDFTLSYHNNNFSRIQMTPTTWSLIIVIGIFLTLIGYVILMYVLASQRLWIFNPNMTKPNPYGDETFFRPLGGFRQLTQDEINERNEQINAALEELGS
jgi:hypothetical protein